MADENQQSAEEVETETFPPLFGTDFSAEQITSQTGN